MSKQRIKTGHLDLHVAQDLVERIDAWRNAQPVPPTRVAAISYMLETWLNAYALSLLDPPDRLRIAPLTPARR